MGIFRKKADPLAQRAQTLNRRIAELEAALGTARGASVPTVIVIDSDPGPGTGAGGAWWEVGVPEVSTRKEVDAARKEFDAGAKAQWLVN